MARARKGAKRRPRSDSVTTWRPAYLADTHTLGPISGQELSTSIPVAGEFRQLTSTLLVGGSMPGSGEDITPTQPADTPRLGEEFGEIALEGRRTVASSEFRGQLVEVFLYSFITGSFGVV